MTEAQALAVADPAGLVPPGAFRPGDAANLVSSWIPALDGVQAKLEAGAQVADVGCGHGASTLIMAHAYPNSSFVGFEYHQPSVRHAQQVAADMVDPVGVAVHAEILWRVRQ